jgi:hypothetical protein
MLRLIRRTGEGARRAGGGVGVRFVSARDGFGCTRGMSNAAAGGDASEIGRAFAIAGDGSHLRTSDFENFGGGT